MFFHHTPKISARSNALFAFASVVALVAPGYAWSAEGDDVVCPRLAIRGQERVKLTETEKRLVCGDAKNASWSQVPDNQAIFHLKTFLQDRGFFAPSFTKEGGRLIALLGKPSEVTSFEVSGQPVELPVRRLRGIVGKRLTPNLLDEVQARVTHLLQGRGYPCSSTDMNADPSTGKLTATVKSGPKLVFYRADEEPVDGMNASVFSRYRAFNLGEPYNSDYLTVTVNRILQSSAVDSAHFTTTCEAAGAAVLQRTVTGPPRLVTVGFGVNTERIGQIRATWKNNRWGDAASNLAVVLFLNSLDQDFSVSGDWYYRPDPSRSYLRPSFNLHRGNYQNNEVYTSRLQLAPAITFDTRETGYRLFAGPSLNLVHTVRGPGPQWGKFLTLSGQFQMRDHYHEFYQNSPRQGYNLGFDFLDTENNVLSNVSAHLLRLNFDKLWNLLNYDPPLLVFGFRGAVATTITSETNQSSLLVDDFRHFLGGRSDLRGFSPREIPGTGYGALTSVYGSFEIRLADKFLFGLQPFVFIDAAVLGAASLDLDDTFFYSPGGGIRWQSPIGVLRTTLAHGYTKGTPPIVDPPHDISHLQFYFTLGEEF